jgi:hypothetical protein
VGKGAEVFAEAEGADALLEGGAVAMEEALEEGFEFEGTRDVLFDLGDFSGSELFPTRAYRSVIAEAAEEELDFGKGEAHFAGEADEEHAVEGVAGVTALAAAAVGRGEKAHFFVIADCRSVEADASGELADFHCSSTLLTYLHAAGAPMRLPSRIG